MSGQKRGGSRRSRKDPAVRRAARLAAVQALYRMELSGGDVEDVIMDVLENERGAWLEGDSFADMEPDFFADITRGAIRRHTELDNLLDEALSDDWSVARLERIIAAILRCAAYELRYRPDVPARVVINEYMEVSQAFFDGDEPRLVNGVLNTVARRLRAEEFDGREDGSRG